MLSSYDEQKAAALALLTVRVPPCDLLTKTEVALALNLSLYQVEGLLERGELVAISSLSRAGRKCCVRIPRSSVLHFIQTQLR